jgi:hypothetical protein
MAGALGDRDHRRERDRRVRDIRYRALGKLRDELER